MFTRRKRDVAALEVGAEAPEFNLPSAQGGRLRLGMRTVRGPVVVAFYRPGNEEDAEYFKALAEKEQEINLASGSVVGVGVAEPDAAREFARASGLKSYLLYDYAKLTSAEWGVLERDRRHGDSSRPAVFIVGPDGKVAHAWTAERPAPGELLEKISAITGLPKKPEEEKPAEAGEEADGEKPKKMSAEERERIKAERRAAREAGKTVKTEETSPAAPGTAAGGDGPKKMSKEERERIKAERRAARESGKSLKTDAPGAPAAGAPEAPPEAPAGEPKKMSAEERERIKAERRAAREAGKSLKTNAPGAPDATGPADAGKDGGATQRAEEAPAAPPKMSKEERERIKAERRAAREAGQSLKKPAGDPSSDEATVPEAEQ
ncbi:MAG TPA: redoxin domain-containing protein [Rubrobacter sp.]|nr:redoxin domain-containing protein [Rubrobacter sp.]